MSDIILAVFFLALLAMVSTILYRNLLKVKNFRRGAKNADRS
jgi:hypothetical protein